MSLIHRNPYRDPQGQKASRRNPVATGMPSPEVPHLTSWKERAVLAAGKGSAQYRTDVVPHRLFLFGSFGKQAFILLCVISIIKREFAYIYLSFWILFLLASLIDFFFSQSEWVK